MPKGFAREIALLTVPVVAIAAVALWRSRSEPPVVLRVVPTAKPLPAKPLLSTPPKMTAFRWKSQKPSVQYQRARFAFVASGYHQFTPRSGLPRDINFSGIRWKLPPLVTQIRIKTNGRWRTISSPSLLPSVSVGSMVYGTPSFSDAALPPNTSEASIGLTLNGVPAGAQAVRLKLALHGAANYSGIWPPGVAFPAGMRSNGKGWYEEPVVSPLSEIEITAAGLPPRGT